MKVLVAGILRASGLVAKFGFWLSRKNAGTLLKNRPPAPLMNSVLVETLVHSNLKIF